jgi:hypothetical protein
MMSSSTKALSKQLLGVRAVLRSKNALTPQTLLEMDVKPASVHVGDFSSKWKVVFGPSTPQMGRFRDRSLCSAKKGPRIVPVRAVGDWG